MNKMIAAMLIAGVAISVFVGSQYAQSAQNNSEPVASSIKSDDDGLKPHVSNENRTVIELFTSQGCSSCPPADALAARLAKDDRLLVITRPVTYWDRIGWKDTLAREDNTRLQRAYASKGNEGAGVYTPQIVVNGGDGAVGSREDKIRTLVKHADEAAPKITAVRDDQGQWTVTIDGKSDHLAGVSLVALSSSETVRIGSGENGGRTLHYTNVVKDEKSLGSWRGEQNQFVIPQQALKISGADKYAIIVQRPGAGPIIAAKLLDI